jgi:6-phosphofructokinase 1
MSGNDIKRIGVLTGGGDCPGLNAVIRAIVKTAILKYGWEVIGIEDGFEGLLEPNKTKMLKLKDVSGILPRGGTILGTTNRGNPFEYKSFENGKLVIHDISNTCMKYLAELKIDVLIVIGGDGSLKIANRFFEEKGVNVIGIPKTIDNDLKATDMTFGFQTAIVTATEAIDKLHTTAESHHRAMIIETMGRYVGWIALESGIAGGADVILIPEIPFSTEKVVEKIKERSKRGSKFSIVVVAEGAKPIGEDVTILSSEDKELGVERLGGIGNKVAQLIKNLSGIETRVTVLGHLQRGGAPCAFDRILSSRFGSTAVDLAAKRCFGEMVCLKTPHIKSIAIREAVSSFKAVDPEGEIVKTAETLGVSFGR